jgi:predicted RNA-binding protein YlxR (DUF448 family)
MANATSTSAPTRTCIGCRRRATTDALVRLALVDGRLVLWGPRASARPAGRGASLHPEAVCLRAALASGAFGRAFRNKVSVTIVDEADLLQQLTAAASAALRSVNRIQP